MALKTLRVSGNLDHAFTVSVSAGNHVIRMDQPQNAAGLDLGPTPLELILAAVAGCFGTIGRFIAHQRKFELRGMRFEIEADYDPDGLLGRRDDVRPGFQALRVRVQMDCDLSREEQQAVLREIERRCPLADNLLHGTDLLTTLA